MGEEAGRAVSLEITARRMYGAGTWSSDRDMRGTGQEEGQAPGQRATDRAPVFWDDDLHYFEATTGMQLSPQAPKAPL